MALQLIPGGDILFDFQSSTARSVNIGNGGTLNAAGESAGVVGRVCLAGRTGNKTISAAGGGRIIWRTGSAITFADAGTTLRIGLQDVSATTGLEDATHDVYAELVGGTDTIAAATVYSTAMETDTKTITHGDLVACVFELTARGGSDSIILQSCGQTTPMASTAPALPYGTLDTGTLAKATQYPGVIIVFDDGTLGWFEGAGVAAALPATSTIAYNTGSATDEYCGVLTLPQKVRVSALSVPIGDLDVAGDTLEVVFYLDPLGSISTIETIAIDQDQLGGIAGATDNGLMALPLATPYDLAANTAVGVALRPTSANSINWVYFNCADTNVQKLKNVSPFGTFTMAGRADQTGSFAETQTYHMPAVGLWVSAFDDGAGGAGGGFSGIIGG